MECFSLNTHLPPRKRLLAELKRENSEFELLPPVPFVSGHLGAQLRDAVHSPSSTLEQIAEVSNSVALAAAEIAMAARNTAFEKAAAAAKARASAKSALLFLDPITASRKFIKVGLTKTKVRKKQIPIKLLYKTKHPAGSKETDEELSRELHHAMNSSERISKWKHKRFSNCGEEVLVCHENSHDQHQGVRLGNKCLIDKSKKKIAVSSQDMNTFKIEKEEEKSIYFTPQQQSGSKFARVVDSRKTDVKRKKLPLSQCDARDQTNQRTLPPYANHHSFNKDPKSGHLERSMSSDAAASSDDGEMSMNITSACQYKKIKVSHCSSNSKVLHTLC